MPSTYTLNNGIELIATGEQSGTWGDTTNTNMSLLDTALDGQVTVTLASAGTSGSPNTLPISDGAVSDGRNRMVIFNDGADLGATAYVQLTPNDAEKIVYIRNALSGSRSIIVFQGTYNASNDYEIPAGTTAVIYFNGGGTGAVAANVFNNAHFDALNIVGAAAVGTTLTVGTSLNIASSTTVDGVLDEDNMASDSATKLATQQSIKAYVDSQVTAQDLDFAGDSGTGAVDLDSQTFTVAGTANEIETSASGQTLTVGLPSNVTITTSLTTPTVKASNIDANDGTAAINIADSTGAVDIDTSLNVDGLIEGDQLRVGGTLGNFDVSAGGNQVTFDYNGFNYINSTGAGSALVVRMGSGSTNAIRFDSDGKVIVNDDGNDTDFRVESNTNTHALFVNAGDSRVGINESSPNAMLHVKTSGTDEMLRLEMVDDSNTAGPDIVMQRVSASPAANDPVGRIRAIGENSDGSGVTYGRMEFFIDDPTAGSESGLFSISTELAGANIQRLAFKPDEVVFNEPSQDSDFRVESDSYTHMFFVDAGNNRIGINNNTPASTIDIETTEVQRFAEDDVLGNVLLYNLSNNGLDNASSSIRYQVSDNNSSNNARGQVGVYQPTVSSHESHFFVNLRKSNGNETNVIDFSSEGDFILRDDATGTGAGPDLELYRDSASPANNDLGPRILFDGENSAGAKHTYGNIFTQYTDVTDGAEDANVMHQISIAGQNRTVLGLTTSEVTINDESQNVDFRVESDSVANMLLVDAGNNRVGVGTGNPQYTFVVSNSGAEGLEISAGGIAANRQNIISYNRSGAAYNALWIDASSIVLEPPGGGGGSVSIGDSDVAVAKLNVKGEVGGNIARFRSDDTYQGFDLSGETTYGNGTVAITPNTIPGSGTANMWTHFATAGTGPGYTIHNVRIDGELETDRSATFNQGGNDFDFRVESNNNANMLFVNAGIDAVGIGRSPSYTLDVEGATRIKDVFYVESTGGANLTQGHIMISSSTSDSPEARGQGVFMFNEGHDRTWYSGTGYNAGGDFHIGFADDTSATTEGARTTNSVFSLFSGASGAVFNDNSADRDFRVESDSNANMLFVDASTDNVGINNSAPTAELDVRGTIKNSYNTLFETISIVGAASNMNTGVAQTIFTISKSAGTTSGFRSSFGGTISVALTSRTAGGTVSIQSFTAPINIGCRANNNIEMLVGTITETSSSTYGNDPSIAITLTSVTNTSANLAITVTSTAMQAGSCECAVHLTGANVTTIANNMLVFA